MKKTNIIITTITAILLLILIVFSFFISPVSNKSQYQDFIIANNTSSQTIIKNLKKERLIKNEVIALILIKLSNKPIYAGMYELSPSQSLMTIIKKLTSGHVKDTSVRITINEGKNVRQIAQIIATKTNHSYLEVMNDMNDKQYINSKINEYKWLSETVLDSRIYYPLEGYLFPDTYIIKSKDEPVSTLLDKMLSRTNQVIKKYQKQFNNNDHNIHQIMTLASIIELEAVNNDSRSKVASVFYNRIKFNMSLGSDVTTYYANKINMNERDLKKSELTLASPYNTRGPGMAGKLPIGPIANPGEASIKAALMPADTKYLYFVADKNKKVYFTKDITEHNNVINKLKKEGLWYNWSN